MASGSREKFEEFYNDAVPYIPRLTNFPPTMTLLDITSPT